MINTKHSFTKNTGSLQKATKLVRTLLDENERLDWITAVYKKSRAISHAKGTQKKFNWYYDGFYKRLTVTYTDGREKPKEKEKPTYYVVWIEGLNAISGEKVKSISGGETEYTTKMTEALRVKPEDTSEIIDILRGRGVAGWALENCLYKVNYAPKNTLYKH